MQKYCTKCGAEKNNESCVNCGKKNNTSYVGKAFVILLMLFSILAIALPSLKNYEEPPNAPKISPVEFTHAFFNVKTCPELKSFLSDNIKSSKDYLESKELNENVETCNKKLNEAFLEFENIQCEEISLKDIEIDDADLNIIISEYSNIVLCNKIPKNEDDSDVLIFLIYDNFDMSYKVEFITDSDSIKRDIEFKKAEIKKEEEIQLRKNTTNPAYKISPEAFIIDEKDIISELPDDNKSVWVEKIIDENTIMVSYIILKGNENIITFATVDLYGLSHVGCYREEAIKFLKQFIEHKYVYLSGGYNYFSEDEYPKVPKKFLLKYVKIWKQDIDTSMPMLDRLYSDKYGEDEIEVNTTMVYMGYGQTASGLPGHLNNYYQYTLESKQLRIKFKNIEEVAHVAKRGFWADGVCK